MKHARAWEPRLLRQSLGMVEHYSKARNQDVLGGAAVLLAWRMQKKIVADLARASEVARQTVVEVRPQLRRHRAHQVEAVAAAHAADAERWRTHSAAEAKRLDEQNAAGLAALPESARAAFGSLDRNALAAALQVFGDLRAAATPPPADPAPPKHPVGGGVQLGAVDAASTLTIPEREWKASQPALARTSDEQVKHLFKLAHPKR